ncbi:MAG: 3-phosphoshikimate 1-carboxyvinyltransferase [Candidatus Omnitrophica bacterium]|nr:3-phosphoshikimate 1-carboxyvinyltransferase [Candidatus Omnitrophota bacterium]MDE2008968.1 3-phosphoshikimate 1-carboxyvinyltransferase [Candidatus Omnitrophota bacterium]MDE2214492.1 3-phosphoshikimate 1-carboxyvinyltransferase [Candidatus Omnitrophota bacterium]MDE2230810.1 3-phosphoshikimate 1-carboxyvinyltransferase [Candidatus Omnitrophota bacterium]
MTFHCPPAHGLQGRIRIPASKSYTLRSLLIAARGGVSHIKDASDCDDALVALRTAKALRSSSKAKTALFSVGESGTTLRFLLPLLALYTARAVVRGKGTLVGRPNAHLCRALRRQGMDIRGTGPRESVPIVYNGGALQGGRVEIDGSLSSQFISGLLIALPGVAHDSRVILTGSRLVSQDYVRMTMQILARAGIVIKRVSAREYQVKGGQVFKGLKSFCVPSDYGLAAFALAAAALLPSLVVLEGNWDDGLVQSDGHILEFMRRMGVDFQKTRRAIKIKGPFDLKGGTFSLKNCPDLVPVMSVLALFARGKTRLVGIRHARAKESDRISDLRNELLKVGARVAETGDTLTIEPQADYKSGQLLDSHHDHRLAMAFTVLGAKIGCRVAGIESCRKSYPNFINDMKSLGAL